MSRHGARPHSAHANPGFRQDTAAIGLASLTRSVLKMKRLIRPVRGFPRNTGLVNASATSRAARARREGLAFTALMDQVWMRSVIHLLGSPPHRKSRGRQVDGRGHTWSLKRQARPCAARKRMPDRMAEPRCAASSAGQMICDWPGRALEEHPANRGRKVAGLHYGGEPRTRP